MSDAAAALLYLRLTSARNMLVTRVTRLKRPKYFLGGIAGVAYLYLVFVRPAAHRTSVSALANSDPETRAALISITALLLVIGLALCWLLPRERASLPFSDAEIAFLFPAPVRRTTLVQYRLIGMHVSILLSAAVFFVISRRWNMQPGGVLVGMLGWWIVWLTVQLHIIGSAFSLTRLTDAGVSRARQQALVSGMLALTIAIVVAFAWRDWQPPQPEDLASGIAVARYFSRLLASAPLSWVLWPTTIVVRTLFASDWRSFVAAAGPALLVYAAHYVWVVRSQTNFEEASMAAAEKRAVRVAAMRRGGSAFRGGTITARQPRFQLQPTGMPQIAFLWKNLLSSASYLRPRTVIVLMAIVIGAGVWLRRPAYADLRVLVGVLAGSVGAYALVLGPLFARQDLRSDRANIDVLKTYPLRGWQIVLGELLTPTVTIATVVYLLLLTAALTLYDPDLPRVSALGWIAGGLALGVLAPTIVAIEILVLNAAILIFPAWASTGTRPEAGIEAMGQRLLLFASIIVVIVVALAPAALIGGAAYWITRWFGSAFVAIGIAVVATMGLLVAEAALGVWFVGLRFDRFDLSAELQPQSK